MSLPFLNSILNSLSACFLITGYFFIRSKNQKAHAKCMILATITSTLFLISYLYYHYHHGATRFPGQGWIRTAYFTILISHTILAVIQVPLILATIFWAIKGRFDKHRKVARIAFPIWTYVSITGVVVYVMLYQLTY